MLRIILMVILSFIASESFSGEWTGEVTVDGIVAGYKEGHMLFSIKGDLHNPNNCTFSSANWYVVHPDDADVDTALKVLMTARSMGYSISFAVSSTKCSSIGNFPAVTRLRIH